MTRWEYLQLVIAIDPDSGQVWIRQGSAEHLGVEPGPNAIMFSTWNSVLNRLGTAGWEVVSTLTIEDSSGQQSWLFKRPTA